VKRTFAGLISESCVPKDWGERSDLCTSRVFARRLRSYVIIDGADTGRILRSLGLLPAIPAALMSRSRDRHRRGRLLSHHLVRVGPIARSSLAITFLPLMHGLIAAFHPYHEALAIG
jgi:hypothetical protein